MKPCLEYRTCITVVGTKQSQNKSEDANIEMDSPGVPTTIWDVHLPVVIVDDDDSDDDSDGDDDDSDDDEDDDYADK